MGFNSIVTWLLRSPFHGLVSKNVMLLTVTGRRSGRPISTPTNYLRDGDVLWVISWRARTWWRNLRGGAPVRAQLAGNSVAGSGFVLEKEEAVAQSLSDYYRKVPQQAKVVKIGLDATGLPLAADCARAAQKMVVIRIDLA